MTALPIMQWDEARLAVNTFEMWQNNNYFVTHFNGAPDMWNTKPPLLIWLQVHFTNLLGPGELSVRMPSALAAAALCLSLFWLFKKYFNSPILGILSVICLLSNTGYMSAHGVRTGDYDSLLTLLTTLYVLFFFFYITEGKRSHLYTFYTFLALACLTKGIAGLLFTPALALLAIYKRKLPSLLKSKETYIGLAGFLTVVLGYYFIRELLNPGYIKAVMDNELSGRYLKVNEEHSAPFDYYIIGLFKSRSTVLLLLLALIAPFLYFKTKGILWDLALFVWISAVVFILVLSISKTKLPWYDLPVYPLLAILATMSVFKISEFIKVYVSHTLATPTTISVAIILIFIVPSYVKVLKTSLGLLPSEVAGMERFNLSKYMQKVIRGELKHNTKYVLYYRDIYAADYEYYQRVLASKNIDITFRSITDTRRMAQFAVVGVSDIKNELEAKNETKTIYTDEHVSILKRENDAAGGKLSEYDINGYPFNSKGLKVVPNDDDPTKALVLIDKAIFDTTMYISYHSMEALGGQERFEVRDIGMWKGKDYNDKYSYMVVRHNGRFLRTAIGQMDPKNPKRNWEEWFGR